MGKSIKGPCCAFFPTLKKIQSTSSFGQLCTARKDHRSDSAVSFTEASLFGNQEARIKAAMETIIYSKTLEWEYESEYRLAIPVLPGDYDWTLMPYHPEEITELYFGAEARADFKSNIIGLAKATNPQISV